MKIKPTNLTYVLLYFINIILYYYLLFTSYYIFYIIILCYTSNGLVHGHYQISQTKGNKIILKIHRPQNIFNLYATPILDNYYFVVNYKLLKNNLKLCFTRSDMSMQILGQQTKVLVLPGVALQYLSCKIYLWPGVLGFTCIGHSTGKTGCATWTSTRSGFLKQNDETGSSIPNIHFLNAYIK